MKKPNRRLASRANIRQRQIFKHRRRRCERKREKRLKIERTIVDRRAFAARHGLMFDSNLARRPVILPATFSLATNYEETVAILIAIRSLALHEGMPVLLHFEHVKRIDPAAALALVAEIYRVRNLRGRLLISGTYPPVWEVYDGLKNMGFFKLLSVAERSDIPDREPDVNKPVYFQFFTDNRANWDLPDMFVEIVEKHIMSLNDLARQRLVKAIGEAITNTLDHAHPNPIQGSMKNRWWLSASFNIAKREVSVVVLDQGVGIPNTLPASEFEQLRAYLVNFLNFRLSSEPSDGEKILAATAYHRSGTGSIGRGRGFHDMKDFIDVCADGELRVLSNRGGYHYMDGREGYENFELSLGGTLIEWRFRHTGIVEMKDG